MSNGSVKSLKKFGDKKLQILTRFDKTHSVIGTPVSNLPKARTGKYQDTRQLLGDDFNIPKAEKVVYEKHMELVRLNMNKQNFEKELGAKLDNIVQDFEDKKYNNAERPESLM